MLDTLSVGYSFRLANHSPQATCRIFPSKSAIVSPKYKYLYNFQSEINPLDFYVSTCGKGNHY